MDEREVQYFWENRAQKLNFLWKEDLIPYKISYLHKFIFPNAKILDLGAGDGSVAHGLLDVTKNITAVEYTDAILQIKNPIKKIKSNILDFKFTEKYDFIFLIGVMNFIVNPVELYEKCHSALIEDGKLIVIHQCGKEQDLEISSLVDGKKYQSLYRSWLIEKRNLELANFTVQVEDPYPPKFNVHSNTVFKSFLCRHLK